MARMLKPPTPLPSTFGRSVFLAGSIEMGQAEDWQSMMERALDDLDVLILNPRRDAWDSTWAQSLANVEFREQVEWELAAQERAALIAMYFAPSTRAPDHSAGTRPLRPRRQGHCLLPGWLLAQGQR